MVQRLVFWAVTLGVLTACGGGGSDDANSPSSTSSSSSASTAASSSSNSSSASSSGTSSSSSSSTSSSSSASSSASSGGTAQEPEKSFQLQFDGQNPLYDWRAENWSGLAAFEMAIIDESLQISPNWGSPSDYSVVFHTLWANADFRGADISFSFFLPADYVADGQLHIQPFIRDKNGKFAAISYLNSNELTAGWNSLSYSDLGLSYTLNYESDGFQLSEIAQIGLGFFADGKPATVEGAFLLDNLLIELSDEAAAPGENQPGEPVHNALVLAGDTAADPALPRPGDENYEAATETVRFLQQASFGATAKSVMAAMAQTPEEWIDAQIALPTTYHLPLLDRYVAQFGLEPIPAVELDEEGWARDLHRSDVWWAAAVWGEDQLRQKVAYALSQILVISNVSDVLFNDSRGIANYQDILLEHAFGNYRDLLYHITLNPMMGEYLSMIRNEKADASRNIRPDENYAREIMQLFSIGLVELNLDGSVKLDSEDQPIPTYGQTEIKELARVFTGWNTANARIWWEWQSAGTAETLPMTAFDGYHDFGEKILFDDQVIPANLSPDADIQAALDILFNHPNIAPFISKQLIQRLVTSNPSPAYVERVASVFNNNGNDVKGDMTAVIKAILLDDEARNGHTDNPTQFGKLREPLLQRTQLFRAFKAQGAPFIGENEQVYFRIRQHGSWRDIGQRPFGSFSVFNFYRPDYQPTGPIKDADLVAPEMQIMTESQMMTANNHLGTNIYWRDSLGDWPRSETPGLDWDNYPNQLYLANEKALAPDREALLDKVNLLFTAGQLDPASYNEILAFMENQDASAGGAWLYLIYDTLLLVSSTPEFAVQR